MPETPTTPSHRREGAARHGAEATTREIARQPEVWRELAGLIEQRRGELDTFLAPLTGRDGLRVIFTGAGTSAFAGGVAAAALARTTGRRFEAVATTDIVASPRSAFGEDVPTLLVSFARSGNSPESMATTRLADALLTDVHHLVITCAPEGALYREHRGASRSAALLMPERSNDSGFAMTSSFTCMLLTALVLFTGAGRAEIEAVARAAEQVIETQWDYLESVAARSYRRVVFLGSGAYTPLAQEAALKLLELTAGQVVSFHDSPLGFRHGPKAVLNDETLAVVFASADPYTRRYDLDIVAELKRALGDKDVLVVGAGGLPEHDILGLDGLDGVDDGLAAAAAIVPAQILALSFGLAAGRTPDNPFPNGDVNRVVKGVRIHEFGQ